MSAQADFDVERGAMFDYTLKLYWAYKNQSELWNQVQVFPLVESDAE